MKVFYKIAKYDQWVEIREGKVKSFNCTCIDFLMRRIHRDPKERCKHLKKIGDIMEKRFVEDDLLAYKELGNKKLTDKQKEVLSSLVNNQCEVCGEEKTLQVHRIKRGYMGGTYAPHNLKMVCAECHKTIHGDEFK